MSAVSPKLHSTTAAYTYVHFVNSPYKIRFLMNSCGKLGTRHYQMLTPEKVKEQEVIFQCSEKKKVILPGFSFRKLPKNAITTTKDKPRSESYAGMRKRERNKSKASNS